MFPLKIAILISFLFVTACTRGLPEGYTQRTIARNLTLMSNKPYFKTCVFDPGYSIVHFPMYHRPPNSRNISLNDSNYELVIQSQFQLLHTLLDYNRSLGGSLAVFDEYIANDSYNQNYYNSLISGRAQQDIFTHLDGTSFFLTERLRTAQALFGNGFPAYYEHLTVQQKAFLWDVGASLTLYLLGELPRLYKVISTENMEWVKTQLNNDFSQASITQNNHLTFEFREQELQKEVNQFYRTHYNYTGIVFIAYGSSHDFSNEFYGYPFQSGHSFCLNWIPNNFNILP